MAQIGYDIRGAFWHVKRQQIGEKMEHKWIYKVVQLFLTFAMILWGMPFMQRDLEFFFFHKSEAERERVLIAFAENALITLSLSPYAQIHYL